MTSPARGETGYGEGWEWDRTQHAAAVRARLCEARLPEDRAEKVIARTRSLYKAGYILPANYAIPLTAAIEKEHVIMFSGVPGCGKTWLAECLNTVECPDVPLLKVEGHEHITEESLLYSVDETSLRLFLETAPRVSGHDDWFRLAEEGRSRFVHYGPIIQSIVWGRDTQRRRVLLIDELDKFDRGKGEPLLLSFLNDYSVALPHLNLYFKARPGETPITIVTKNESRQITQPTQRRCIVFPVATPTILDEDEILCQKAPELHPLCRYFLLLLVHRIRSESLGMQKPVSISETVDLAEALAWYASPGIELELIADQIPYLAKNEKDQHMLGRKIESCYAWAVGELRSTGGDLGRAYQVLVAHNRAQLEARRKRAADIRL